MGTSEEISRRYPRQIELDASLVPPGPQFLRIRPAGQPHQVQPVSLRLMGAADKAAMLQLARSLPQEDLLFLHSDITDPASVDEWITNIENGAMATLLAELNGLLAGYASLHVNPLRWTRRVGEIAINITPEWRSRGLGEGLCAEIVALAGILSLEKSLRGWWRTIRARGLCSKGSAFMWRRYCRTGSKIVTVIAGTSY